MNDTFQEITKISGRLSSVDERFKDLAKAVGVEYGPMKMEERIELTANLDALVCCSYGLNRQEYEYILDTFDAFEEDEKLKNIGEQYEWNDAMIRKLNGEVKKMAIYYYDKITEKVKLR